MIGSTNTWSQPSNHLLSGATDVHALTRKNVTHDHMASCFVVHCVTADRIWKSPVCVILHDSAMANLPPRPCPRGLLERRCVLCDVENHNQSRVDPVAPPLSCNIAMVRSSESASCHSHVIHVPFRMSRSTAAARKLEGNSSFGSKPIYVTPEIFASIISRVQYCYATEESRQKPRLTLRDAPNPNQLDDKQYSLGFS